MNPPSAELIKMHPERHPMLPWMSLEEAMPLLETPEGRGRYANWVNTHRRRVILAESDEEGDPYQYGWELDHWRRADAVLRASGRGQCVFGGKRATKSERAARRVVQSAMHLARTRIWCMQGTGKTSIAEQQSLVWKYLPPHIKAINGKSRHGWAKLNYTQDGGFASNILVLPNRSEIHFLTYNQDDGEYQGWSLGAPPTADNRRLLEDSERYWWLINIGAWADENLTLSWFDTIELRCATRAAKWMWTFSTLDGMTQTMKAAVGVPKTIESRPAVLLAQNRRHVSDCPEGHMPVVQQSSNQGISIVYFHTDQNPFPPNYEQVKMRLSGKTEKVIKQDAYGYAEDIRNRAFPKFSAWNVIPVSALPAFGTNYQFLDPAGARMWFSVWVRVVGAPPRFYIYRDQPERTKWGAWAIPSKNQEELDGVAGPAQNGRGWGWVAYKQSWLSAEQVFVPPHLRAVNAETLKTSDIENAIAFEQDPYRQGLLRAAILEGRDVESVSEDICQRYIDPRACEMPQATASGATTALIELGSTQLNPVTGAIDGPSMLFSPAPGLAIDTGITAVNQLLDWDMTQPLCPMVNEPRLYVSENCEQVIEMMNTFTGTGGRDAGHKDPFDLVRYIATAGLWHRQPVKTRRGGSY